jgi:AcrR family transcriptional regulator
MARVKTLTKEREILEAASKIFAVKPFHEVLVDSIASDAGIGKGTIYRYFETKEDLYFATVLHVVGSLAVELDQRVRAETSAIHRLEAIATQILTQFWERRYLLPFFQRDERFPMLEVEIVKRREPILRVVQEAILYGIEQKELRGVDARLASELFLGMVRAMNLFHTSDDRLEDVVAQLMSVFIAGVGRGET